MSNLSHRVAVDTESVNIRRLRTEPDRNLAVLLRELNSEGL